MGIGNVNRSYLVGGRLGYGASAYDGDGSTLHTGETGLGVVSRAIIQPNYRYVREEREEDNGTETVIFLGGRLIFAVLLEEWDPDALAVLFPNSDTSTGDEIVKWPGSDLVAGEDMSARALQPLIFTPDNVTENPAFVAYDAIPMVAETAELRLSAFSHLRVPVMFECTLDSGGKTAEFGILSKLTTP